VTVVRGSMFDVRKESRLEAEVWEAMCRPCSQLMATSPRFRIGGML
jgi:hypothetical protein